MKILNSIWSVQHPNAGRNIQQVSFQNDFSSSVKQECEGLTLNQGKNCCKKCLCGCLRLSCDMAQILTLKKIKENVCCVFQPANGCSTRGSLVEINLLMLKR